MTQTFEIPSRNSGNGRVEITFIPEPSTGLLVLSGLLGLTARRRWYES